MAGSRRWHCCSAALAGFLFLYTPGVPGTDRELAAQVPVIRIQEPGPETTEILRAQIPRSLTWDAKKAILLEQGIRVPPRAPAQFTLTPASPIRRPGGYLYAGGMELWYAGRGNFGGSNGPEFIYFLDRGTLSIRLEGLKPRAQYLLDLSLSGSQTVSVYGSCHYGGQGSPHIGDFPLAGQQHVFIVVTTSAKGDACTNVRLQGVFVRVEIAELGSTP